MADVVNLFNKKKRQSKKLNNPQSVQLLNSFSRNADHFKDLIIFFKRNDGVVGIFETDISIEDKCLMLQLVQHQITSYLDRHRIPADTGILEPDA